MSSAQLEQQFQARIAQAKEAARLASIAAAARGQNASNGPPFALAPAVPGVPFQSPLPPPSKFIAPEPLAKANIPPDVKNRIDRLVEFVVRNGDAFEATAMQRERDNPDFAFLKPGGAHSDYYQWKKQQMCGTQPPQAGSPMGFTPSPPPRASNTGEPPSSESKDPLGDISVGAMANVCKFARANGVPAYAPISQEVINNVGSLPLVESARLEIRLSEFYRDEEYSRR